MLSRKPCCAVNKNSMLPSTTNKPCSAASVMALVLAPSLILLMSFQRLAVADAASASSSSSRTGFVFTPSTFRRHQALSLAKSSSSSSQLFMSASSSKKGSSSSSSTTVKASMGRKRRRKQRKALLASSTDIGYRTAAAVAPASSSSSSPAASTVATATLERRRNDDDDDEQEETERYVREINARYNEMSATGATATAMSPAAEAAASAEEKEKKDREVLFARLLLIGAAALYGTNFSCVKLLGQTDIPIGLSATLRFGMAAIATSPWLFLKTRNPPQEGKVTAASSEASAVAAVAEEQNLLSKIKAGMSSMSPEVAATVAGLEVGMWNSIGYVSQAIGLETTDASKSAFLCSLAVVIVPILDFFFSKKSMQTKQIAGTLMALVGVAILELGGGIANAMHLSSGDIASLVQPVAFGMGFWRMEHAMRDNPQEANRCTAAQLLAVFASSFLYCALAEPGAFNVQQIMSWMSDPMILLSLFWTGCITTALTVYMETLALKTLSAAETTLIFSTEPLWGTACAAAVMHEQLGMNSMIGAVLILSGCIFSNLGIEGIGSLLKRKGPEQGAATNESPEKQHQGTPEGRKEEILTAGGNRARQLGNGWIGKAGLVLGVGGAVSGAWNNLEIGARVFSIEMQEFVEEVLPFIVDN